MSTETIRKRLHQYIETAGGKKIRAIFTLFEEEIQQLEWEYSDQFKEELDKRMSRLKKGGAMINGKDAGREVSQLLKSKQHK